MPTHLGCSLLDEHLPDHCQPLCLVSGKPESSELVENPASTSFLSSPSIPLHKRHLSSSPPLPLTPIIQEPYCQASGWGDGLQLVLMTRVRMMFRLSQPQLVNSHNTLVSCLVLNMMVRVVVYFLTVSLSLKKRKKKIA